MALEVDRTLAALADPARRAIVELLQGQPQRPSEVARRLAVSRPTLSRHLRVLREAGLLDERIADGDADVTPQDRQRVAVLLAEARAQLADARAGEALALASVRALAEDATVDIDEAPLEALAFEPASDEDAVARAEGARPE